MRNSILAVFLIVAGCSAGAPATPSPAPATPTPAPTVAPTVAPTAMASATAPASAGQSCDPYYGDCGGSTSPSPSAAGSTVVITDSAGATPHLLGGDGNALYTFDNDSAGQSACGSGCTDTWPPLIVPTGYQLQAGGHEDDYATITRSDGSLQLTYYGKPLYNYAGDVTATDTQGDGLFGKWHLAIQQP